VTCCSARTLPPRWWSARYSYEAKNDDDLADTIVYRINEMLNEDGSVWGK
jgi:hypothetical protein